MQFSQMYNMTVIHVQKQASQYEQRWKYVKQIYSEAMIFEFFYHNVLSCITKA